MEMLARIFKIAKNATLVVRAVDGCGSVVRAAEQNSHKIQCQNHDYVHPQPAFSRTEVQWQQKCSGEEGALISSSLPGVLHNDK